MPAAAADLTLELEAIRATYGRDAAARKLELLWALASKRLSTAEAVLRLHESLLFLRAFPDSPHILEAAEDGLSGFAQRVRRLERRGAEAFDALDEKGIAGTSIYTAFSLPIARWLASRYPGQVDLYAEGGDVEERLSTAFTDLVLPAEAEAIYDGYIGSLEWMRRTAGAAIVGTAAADASPLLRLLAIAGALGLDERALRALWAALELPLVWRLGDGDGSRTLARAPMGEPAFQRRPFDRSRVSLRAEAADAAAAAAPAPRFERPSPLATRAWIDVARAAIAARLREVHTFNYASPDDVTVAECGEGLRIALLGVQPPARHALRVFYGYLLAKNGVPVGYGDALMLFDWGELNFHVFDTFRQAESARAYAAVVAVFRQRFGIDYLFLNRYQFGHRNPDAVRSGAFWFYEKLGFRPRDPAALALWRRERRHLDADPSYRSPAPVLERLARGHMGLALAEPPGALERFYRRFHPMNLGLAVSRRVERVHGGDRRSAARAAERRLRRLLRGAWSGEEARALERLAPVLDLIPDLEEWTADERKDLALAVRLKSGAAERDHLLALQRHRRLREALVRLG